MGEEANADGKKSPEMTPQEDGTKVPLTDDGPTVTVEEAKFVPGPNGDAKIDIGSSPAFSGLTKEELMKYSNDPFWVRLRWLLFIMFWVGWLAMLVVAIIIIVKAPSCEPPPELLWVEEHPMMELNPHQIPTEKALMKKCDDVGISSVYMPNLISSSNFDESNYNATGLIEALGKYERHVVTDLPAKMDINNPLYGKFSASGLIHNDGTWNYNDEGLANAVFTEIVLFWMEGGVNGFIMEDTDTAEKMSFKTDLNGLAKEKGGAIGSNIVELRDQYKNPILFKEYLEDIAETWTFSKFNTNRIAGSSIDQENMRLLTIGLFMSSGTPVLDFYEAVDNSTSELLMRLTKMKAVDGVKFGNTSFVNGTGDDVIAYTRIYKGTPAYAVALNFNNNSETVSFEGMDNIGATGTVEIRSQRASNSYETREKHSLSSIDLAPYEGLVLQFVASF